jgi:hypothetical protein
MQWSSLMFFLALVVSFQTPRGIVEGVVVRWDTLQPVEGAKVTLSATGQSLTTMTDEAGKFVFPDVVPGEYRLVASLDFAVGEFGRKSPYNSRSTVSVGPNERVTDLAVSLIPPGTISGLITLGQTGQPVQALVVELSRKDYDNEGLLRSGIVATVVSDARGKYRFSNISPGHYELVTRTSTHAGTEVYIPAATLVELSPGQRLNGIDFVVSPTRPLTIRGRIIDDLHRRLPHLDWITLIPRSENEADRRPRRLPPQQNKNTFDIPDVVPGPYYVSVYRFDDEHRAEGVVAVDVHDRDIEDLVISSGAGCNIRGRLRFEGSSLNASGKMIRVSMRPVDDPTSVVAKSAWVTAGGVLQLLDLPCERLFRLSFTGIPFGYYVKSARIAKVDVLEKPVSPPDLAGVLEIVLAQDAGKLTGKVIGADGNSVDSAHIVLVPRNRGRFDLYRVANTDQRGRFAIMNVAPGDYDIYAWEELKRRMYYDADFLHGFAGFAQHIQVTSAKSLDLEVRRIASIDRAMFIKRAHADGCGRESATDRAD